MPPAGEGFLASRTHPVGLLGAQFVFVGRPFLFAAVAAGEPGVQRALTLLKDEVDRDMALLGVRSITEVTPDLLRRLGPEPPFGRNTP